MISFWENEQLSTWFLGGYLLVLTLSWLMMIIGVRAWGRKWMVQKPTEIPETTPLLSICIPARNEEENIAACVEAALRSSWPNLEVVVVDDRSTDQTRARAVAAANDDPRFVLIAGQEPALGWAGKPWTCARAAKESKGSWLLFVDADVCLHRDAATAAILLAEERQLDLLSFFGSWELVGFWERCVIPAVGWLIRGTVNFDEVNNPARPEGFANGQFIMMRRKSYMEIEGHAVVRDQVLEDVRLAQVVKRAGYRAEIRPATWSFRVRLYRSLGEIISGYTKNLYEGMNRNIMVGIASVLFILFGSIFPFVGFLGAILSFMLQWNIVAPIMIPWFFLICCLQLIFRYKIEKFDGRDGSNAWVHPLANIILVYILIRSTFGVRVQWKGRSFVDGKAEKSQ